MMNNKILIIVVALLLSFNIGMVGVKGASTITGQYGNYNNKESKVYCGGSAENASIKNIPAMFPRIVSAVYFGLEIAVPILLVVFGIIDLIKAITSGKEDDIKRNQMTFVRRLIVAVLTFFVFAIVKLLVNFAADNNKENILDCVNCFLNYNVDESSKCGT